MMQSDLIFPIAIGLLVIVEIGLIVAIRQLTNRMDIWSGLFQQAEKKIQDINKGINFIGGYVKKVDLLRKGEINLQGTTPLGNIDLDIKLSGKNGKKKINKTN